MARITLPTAALLALAACQQPASDSNIAIDNGINAADADVETLPPSEEGSAPAVENSTTSATMPTAIPAQFHGRWGLTKADCTSTRGDAKGLLVIDDARLTFFESKGTLGKVLGATETSFDADYGFSGEGQSWERVERLKMVKANLNRRTDAKAGQEPPVDLTYMRCAN